MSFFHGQKTCQMSRFELNCFKTCLSPGPTVGYVCLIKIFWNRMVLPLEHWEFLLVSAFLFYNLSFTQSP